MTMNEWTVLKDIATFLVACAAAWVAVFNYRKNAKTRRAEFLCDLHKSFFEDPTYKQVRKALDTDDELAMAAFVKAESEEFTDYLNFFELVAYLQRQGNLSLEDVLALLGYYLGMFRQHQPLRDYIWEESRGFEELRRLLGIIEQRKIQREG